MLEAAFRYPGDKTGSVLRAWPHSNMHRSLKPRIKYHNSLKSTVNAAGWLHLLVYCYTIWCHVWHFLFPFKIRLYSQVKKGPRKDRRKEPSKQAPKTVGFQVNACSAAKASHCVSTVLCISTNLYFGVLSLGEQLPPRCSPSKGLYWCIGLALNMPRNKRLEFLTHWL